MENHTFYIYISNFFQIFYTRLCKLNELKFRKQKRDRYKRGFSVYLGTNKKYERSRKVEVDHDCVVRNSNLACKKATHFLNENLLFFICSTRKVYVNV